MMNGIQYNQKKIDVNQRQTNDFNAFPLSSFYIILKIEIKLIRLK